MERQEVATVNGDEHHTTRDLVVAGIGSSHSVQKDHGKRYNGRSTRPRPCSCGRLVRFSESQSGSSLAAARYKEPTIHYNRIEL